MLGSSRSEGDDKLENPSLLTTATRMTQTPPTVFSADAHEQPNARRKGTTGTERCGREEAERVMQGGEEHCRVSITTRLQQGSFKRLLTHTHTHTRTAAAAAYSQQQPALLLRLKPTSLQETDAEPSERDGSEDKNAEAL